MRKYLGLSLIVMTLIALPNLILVRLAAGAPAPAIPQAGGPLNAVTLAGPALGPSGTSLSFTATVSPAAATQPVNYSLSEKEIGGGKGRVKFGH